MNMATPCPRVPIKKSFLRPTLSTRLNSVSCLHCHPICSRSDSQERRKRKEGVDDGEDTTENERELSVELNLVLEQDRRVVDDTGAISTHRTKQFKDPRVATTELLEELGRSTDKSTTEMLLLSTLEDITVSVRRKTGLSGNSIRN
jgi:hypothetical protein